MNLTSRTGRGLFQCYVKSYFHPEYCDYSHLVSLFKVMKTDFNVCDPEKVTSAEMKSSEMRTVIIFIIILCRILSAEGVNCSSDQSNLSN